MLMACLNTSTIFIYVEACVSELQLFSCRKVRIAF